MKNLVLLIATFLVISACEGPIGPQGPQGLQGQDGAYTVGITDEIEFDFSRQTFDFFYEFPGSYKNDVLPSDAVLVYLLWEIDNGVDIWRQMPLTIFFGQDILQYAFDHTSSDVMLYMDGNFDLNELPDLWFFDWVARIVIVPADYAAQAEEMGIDLSDYEQTSAHFELDFGKSKIFDKEQTVVEKMKHVKDL